MADEEFDRGISKLLGARLKTHGQQTYVAHLEGNSATSLAARRSQYLVLVQSQDLSLVMLRLRMGANGFLTSLQDYPITVQTTIKIDYDGGTYTATISSESSEHAPLPWVQSGEEQAARMFFRALHNSLKETNMFEDMVAELWNQMVAYKVMEDSLSKKATPSTASTSKDQTSFLNDKADSRSYATTTSSGLPPKKANIIREPTVTFSSWATSDSSTGFTFAPTTWGVEVPEEDWSVETTPNDTFRAAPQPTPKPSKPDQKQKNSGADKKKSKPEGTGRDAARKSNATSAPPPPVPPVLSTASSSTRKKRKEGAGNTGSTPKAGTDKYQHKDDTEGTTRPASPPAPEWRRKPNVDKTRSPTPVAVSTPQVSSPMTMHNDPPTPPAEVEVEAEVDMSDQTPDSTPRSPSSALFDTEDLPTPEALSVSTPELEHEFQPTPEVNPERSEPEATTVHVEDSTVWGTVSPEPWPVDEPELNLPHTSIPAFMPERRFKEPEPRSARAKPKRSAARETAPVESSGSDDSERMPKVKLPSAHAAPFQPEFTDRSTAELSLIDTTNSYHEHSRRHELKTAPLVSYDAKNALTGGQTLEQYGVMGAIQSIRFMSSSEIPEDRRLYLNTNTPFSAMVCGVQGSGKSHTVSVMLENMLVTDYWPVGNLVKPLSGLVLHFGEGGPSAQPCEAAWVGVPAISGLRTPKVKVYVSPSSINTMRKIYSRLGSYVKVEPLLFREAELDAEAILSMMAIGSSDSAPLYVQIILSILRELGESYTWSRFQAKLELKKKSFNPAQLIGLEQRLSLLQSFMERSNGQPRDWDSRFEAGQLTIIDLSDPFIDPASACGLFEIVTRLFKRADVGTGKVLVVDEAHKYLSTQTSSSSLTQALLSMIRQMRHLALRVIISTQEPTVVPPVLLDLCSVSVIHRFQSPSWWEHLRGHVSAECGEGFDEVVQLHTGQAIVFAPAALIASPDENGELVPCKLDRRYLLVKTRQRVTKDGGASILVVDADD